MVNKPLVSIVIPTYQRPKYFAMALESVLAQTYTNLDIFITDNSHDEETKKLMQRYLKDKRITYEHHPEFNALENWARAFSYNNEKAEYVNWLMDDDVFMPNKIELMLELYEKYPNVSLVTSYRGLIDAEGNLVEKPSWKPLVDKAAILLGQNIGKQMLMNLENMIGEPTTVLVKNPC